MAISAPSHRFHAALKRRRVAIQEHNHCLRHRMAAGKAYHRIMPHYKPGRAIRDAERV